jgi:competence protein ComGF
LEVLIKNKYMLTFIVISIILVVAVIMLGFLNKKKTDKEDPDGTIRPK